MFQLTVNILDACEYRNTHTTARNMDHPSAVSQFSGFFLAAAVVVMLLLLFAYFILIKRRREEPRGGGRTQPTTEEIADCFHCANRRCFPFFCGMCCLGPGSHFPMFSHWHCGLFYFSSFLPSFISCCHSEPNSFTERMGKEKKKNLQRMPQHVSTPFSCVARDIRRAETAAKTEN